ncbi:MAG TPA: glycosyltransferase [Chitinophagaceae bacterium]|nr:glycosyltransferase [Chitinophagaceae bacterium]
MNLSVIIPAYNAIETISETLDSLLAQSSGNWEAIVVDDGSTDGTASVVYKYSEKDQRISLVRQSNGGLSAARNTGIAAARYEYLLFLDADDWISPDYIENFKKVFEAEPGIDAAVCGWQFVLEDGSAADNRYPPADEDMFPHFSHTCPFVVHACVINRRLIESAGVFDSKVGYVEDWDFWQRVSRAGARFRSIKEVLAFYRMRKGSLSRKVFQSYNDARKMICQGYAEDNRVQYPVEKYRAGMQDEKKKEHLSWLYCWYAGLCIGVGEDPEGLGEPDIYGFRPDPSQLASFIFESIYRGGCFLPAKWLQFYQEHREDIDALFDVLAGSTGQSSVIHDSKLELFCMIARGLDEKESVMEGTVLYLPVEITDPLKEIAIGAARVILHVKMEAEELGRREFNTDDGKLDETKIREAISDEWSWEIMTRYLKYRHPDVEHDDLQGAKGWELFLQEFWGLNWGEPAFYDASYIDNSTYDTKDCKELIQVETSETLFNVRLQGSSVNIEYYVGGKFAGRISLQGTGGILSAHSIRVAITTEGKFDICRIAVNQGLIGRKLHKVVLREELNTHR